MIFDGKAVAELKRDDLGIGQLCGAGRRCSHGGSRFHCRSMVTPALAGLPRGQQPVANRLFQVQAFYQRFRDIKPELPNPRASRRDASTSARGFNPGNGKPSEVSPAGTTEIWSEGQNLGDGSTGTTGGNAIRRWVPCFSLSVAIRVANRLSQVQAFYQCFRDMKAEFPNPRASRRDAATLARGFNPGNGKPSEVSPVGTTEIRGEGQSLSDGSTGTTSGNAIRRWVPWFSLAVAIQSESLLGLRVRDPEPNLREE